MRQSVASVGCASNLRQIYTGILAYTEDNRGFIPPAHGKDLSYIYELYDFNQYWWNQAYLAPYLVERELARWGAGQLTQKEAEIFNCSGRNRSLDDFWNLHSTPSVSYVMFGPNTDAEYRLLNIPNRSQRLLITEGRHSVCWEGVAFTNPDDSIRDPARYLRRFHGNSMNLLFWDGHIERFSGPDQDLQQYLK